jgi:pimeloyl-ACP methyl ester carboxylesterase
VPPPARAEEVRGCGAGAIRGPDRFLAGNARPRETGGMRFVVLWLLVAIVGCAAPRAPSATPLFRTHVRGSGRPVIFIADLGAPPEVWDSTLEHLGPGVQSHVVAVAGLAGNPPAREPVLPGLVDQLAAYIEAERLARPIIVGHMFGGTVAWMLAMAHSERLGGIVVIDAPPVRDAEQDPEAEADAAGARRLVAEATPERFATMMSSRLTSSMNDAVRAKALAAKASRSDQHVLAEAMYAMMTARTSALIGRIHTRVLVLLTTANLPEGASDDVTALYRRQIDPIPERELVVVEGSHHYVMFDAPEAYHAQLDRFLGTTRPARR